MAPAPRAQLQPARVPKLEAIDHIRSEVEPVPPKPAQVPSLRPGAQRSEAKRPQSTLLEELVLIGKAKELARDGKPDEAGAVLDEHARRFAEGELSDERREIRDSLGPPGQDPTAGP